MISLPRLLRQIKSSYSAKLICIFIATLLLMAALLNYTFIRLQQKSFRTYTRENALTIAALLAKSIDVDLFTENVDNLQRSLANLDDLGNLLQVQILTADGKVIGSRLFHSEQGITPPASAAIMAAGSGENSFFREWPDFFTCWTPVLSSPRPAGKDALYEDTLYFDAFSRNIPPPQQETLGYVTMVISKKQYQEELDHILVRSGLVILIILSLLISGTILIFRRLTQPLKQLIARIKQEKNISETHDEIGLLDSTVTNLIKDLDSSFQTITALNHDLEGKVAQRTAQLARANSQLIKRQEYLEEANRKLEQAMQELRETESQLIQSERMAAIGQVVAGVAHEINNNINFISGALPSLNRAMADIRRLIEAFAGACRQPTAEKREEALLLHKGLSEEELFDSLDQLMANIREGVQRTTKIIADLKTFSRSDEQSTASLDLNASLDSTITFLDKEHLDHVKIIKEYGDLPPVHCRADRINQVFLNIMNNALHAMAPAGGHLTITTFADNNEAHIRFQDTGIGINRENLPKIFDPFYTSKEIGQGTGIGLAISYQIIKQHNGRIEVTSEDGRGSTFEVILPL